MTDEERRADAEARVRTVVDAALVAGANDLPRSAAICTSAAAHLAVASGLPLDQLVDCLTSIYESAVASKMEDWS